MGAVHFLLYFILSSLSFNVQGGMDCQSVILRMRNEINSCEKSGVCLFCKRRLVLIDAGAVKEFREDGSLS